MPRDELASKIGFWPTKFFFEIYDHVSKSDFGPLLNGSNFRFWSRDLLRIEIGAKSEIRSIEKWSKIGFCHLIIIFEEQIEWSKIGYSKKVHHVGMNSFKHFSGAKKGPPRNRFWFVNFNLARNLSSTTVLCPEIRPATVFVAK